MQDYLTLLPLFLYSASSLLFLAYLFNFRDRILVWAKWVLFGAFVVHLAATGYAHLSGGAIPITHPYSLLSLTVLAIAGIFLLTDLYVKITIIGSFLIPVNTLLLLVIHISLTGTPEAGEKSHFMKFITPVHIAASNIGFLLFFVAFLSSVLYIVQEYRLRLKKSGGFLSLPSLARLERIAFKSVTIGFPIYSFGIILGTVWSFTGQSHFSHQYILALISWVIYGLLLYFYITTGWHGRKASIMMIAGFLSTLGVVLFYLLRMIR
ncbi:MAG: cytochrome c biogenesis protein CcsA [Deltaproteobacteria bacterium]|nr:cytochrome c biogenesis protein CcsA [Deltaproteobacteria bacterium]